MVENIRNLDLRRAELEKIYGKKGLILKDELEMRNFLEINSYLDIESELGGRLKSEIIQLENYPTHYLHSLRCGCYALKITDYLKKIEPVVFIGQIKNYTDSNFKKYQQIFYIASLLHDVGKREFPELITKTDLTEEEIILLRGHVEKSRDIIKSINETSAEIALRHHLYQPKSYPYGINGSTPEIEVLSRLLGKIDNWDTRTTRVNNRNNYNYYEKAIIMFNKIKNNNNFIPQQIAKKLIGKEYQKVNLYYGGTNLPRMNFNCGKLIDLLVEDGIFGSKNPLNPFEKFYSFRVI